MRIRKRKKRGRRRKVYALDCGMASLIGTRPTQQDCLYSTVRGSKAMAIVCDGMGGLQGGEQASHSAVKRFVRDYQKRNRSFPPSAFMPVAANRMDQAVHNLKDKNKEPMHAGTTVVAVIIEENRLYWLGVGDSRVYLIRGNRMRALNRDHNYRMRLDEALSQGIITEEIYRKEERKAEALISYIGKGGLTLIDYNAEPFYLQNGDRILLCSDGLYRTLDNSKIMDICYSDLSGAQETAERLTETAVLSSLERQDNTSAVVIQYSEHR